MSEHQNKHKLSFHSHTQSVNTPPDWNCRIYWTGLAQSNQLFHLQFTSSSSFSQSGHSAGFYFTAFLLHCALHSTAFCASFYCLLRFILLHSGALYDCHHCQQSVYFYHLPVIHFRYVHLIKLKTLSAFVCLGCCLTSLLDLANSGTLVQEETFPVRCSVLSRASCIAH